LRLTQATDALKKFLQSAFANGKDVPLRCFGALSKDSASGHARGWQISAGLGIEQAQI